jgi:hypothetical protein
MTIFSSIFNSFIFLYAFGEKLSLPKIFGMFIATLCIVFLCLEAYNKPENNLEILEDGTQIVN